MSTAMILGLPTLVLLVGPANDSSQRSIKSSAEILGDTSAFRSASARGSRDCEEESHQRSGGVGAKVGVNMLIVRRHKREKGRVAAYYSLNKTRKEGSDLNPLIAN